MQLCLFLIFLNPQCVDQLPYSVLYQCFVTFRQTQCLWVGDWLTPVCRKGRFIGMWLAVLMVIGANVTVFLGVTPCTLVPIFFKCYEVHGVTSQNNNCKFKTARFCSVSWAIWIQSVSSYDFYPKIHLISHHNFIRSENLPHCLISGNIWLPVLSADI